MGVITERRLPGIYFQAEGRLPGEVLPRMDVAAFVGFATCGPLHTPVPVEDVERFRDVFGDDLPLAWDREAGGQTYAHLGSAVEAFFRNGGRRCWVVRVAEQAATNAFLLPGLIDAATGRPALARARCPGSWSDDLRVSAVLERHLFDLVDLRPHGDHYTVELIGQPDEVRPGDVLELSISEDRILYLTARQVAPARAMRNGFEDTTARQGPRIQVAGVAARYYRRIRSFQGATTATVLNGTEPAPVFTVVAADDAFTLQLEGPRAPRVETGHILHIQFGDGSTVWQSVAEVISEEESADGASSMRRLRILPEGRTPLDEPVQTTMAMAVQRLRFELLVWQGQEILARLPNLGLSDALNSSKEPSFNDTPTRFWGRLPSDNVAFRLHHGKPTPPKSGTLEADVFAPRLPLAGPRDPAPLYVPLGMPTRPNLDRAQGRLVTQTPEKTPLERDGVSAFSATLFLDTNLTPHGLGALLKEANHKLYVRGEPLRGLHSLLPIDEVALLAVPDAAHRTWELQAPQPLLFLPTPDLLPLTLLDEPDVYRLAWTLGTRADPEVVYELQEAIEPTFSQPILRYAGRATATEFKLKVDGDDCPRRYFYRVRAVKGRLQSPWSITRSQAIQEPLFETCGVETLATPTLERLIDNAPPRAEQRLRWLPADGAESYTLEEATDPAFSTPTTIFEALDPTRLPSSGPYFFYRFQRQQKGVYYYRIRAERPGEVSPWSNTAFFSSLPRRVWTLIEPEPRAGFVEQNDDLLNLHRALLRFCTARGDVLAVLSLPHHYREAAVLAHIAALTPDPSDDVLQRAPGQPLDSPLLNLDEELALSYGALYHPWPAVRSSDEGRLHFAPPGGPVCGFIARRTLARGAWIAPANEELRGVLALGQPFDAAGWGRLLARGANAVRPDPRGFILLSAETLSRQGVLRLINVRRLLILLRRLALREGNTYVFEPNSPALRERIYFRFRELLSLLFTRGAFAGRIPAEAFEVVTNASVNPEESIDQGRLIVELRVAPARPLEFLTVRLLQRGTEGLAFEEVIS